MTNKFTVLVVEDEKNISSFITKILTNNDYKATTASTGKEAEEIICSRCPDVILLDLGLPDIDGIEIIKRVRRWSSCPIIVISARSRENEKVAALDAGADDYLTKPFGNSELLARIRTALRHSNKLNTDSALFKRPYYAGGLSVDFLAHKVTVDNAEIHLTPVEFKIISYLARNSGKVVTYSSIMVNTWGPYAEEDNKILRVNMANIRRKIEKNPAEPKYIFTEIGVGYRMLEDEPPKQS